jgi:hypothetical protein
MKNQYGSAVEVLTFDEAKKAGIQFQTGVFNSAGKINPNEARKVLEEALRAVPEASLAQLRGFRITLVA